MNNNSVLSRRSSRVALLTISSPLYLQKLILSEILIISASKLRLVSLFIAATVMDADFERRCSELVARERSGHAAVAEQHLLYVWGGYMVSKTSAPCRGIIGMFAQLTCFACDLKRQEQDKLVINDLRIKVSCGIIDTASIFTEAVLAAVTVGQALV